MSETPSPSSPPATVLVVDDEAAGREMLTLLLEAQGLRVTTAEDGETALAIVAATPPDLILLDVMMPGLDGFEVCRRLKNNADTVFIPVVFLTALHSAKERIRGAAAGADDFLSKPFDVVELATRVKSLLRIKSLQDQLLRYNRELEQAVAERTAELQRALGELQVLDRLKSEFMSNVSHELRTPLVHVKGCIHLLADGALGPVTLDQSRSVKVAQEAIRRLENIVADIVDFSDASTRRLQFEAVPLAEVCQAVVQELSPSAIQRQIALSLALAPDLPPVRADRPALARILRHLLDNAVKFSQPGSTVQITAEALPGTAAVRLAMQDHGRGIAPEHLTHIFDPFYQVDGSSTRPVNGLGVGLTLVKKLVEAHGSHVCVESQEAKGSRFYFDLQAAE
jgi:signal transduction histidine kinase